MIRKRQPNPPPRTLNKDYELWRQSKMPFLPLPQCLNLKLLENFEFVDETASGSVNDASPRRGRRKI
jgi:hypothetical protein